MHNTSESHTDVRIDTDQGSTKTIKSPHDQSGGKMTFNPSGKGNSNSFSSVNYSGSEVCATSRKVDHDNYIDFMHVNREIYRISDEIENFWRDLRKMEQMVSEANANVDVTSITTTNFENRAHRDSDGVATCAQELKSSRREGQAAPQTYS